MLTPLPGHAQQDGPNWPNKAIRCIIPTAPGGGSDQIVRLLGRPGEQSLGVAAALAVVLVVLTLALVLLVDRLGPSRRTA